MTGCRLCGQLKRFASGWDEGAGSCRFCADARSGIPAPDWPEDHPARTGEATPGFADGLTDADMARLTPGGWAAKGGALPTKAKRKPKRKRRAAA